MAEEQVTRERSKRDEGCAIGGLRKVKESGLGTLLNQPTVLVQVTDNKNAESFI